MVLILMSSMILLICQTPVKAKSADIEDESEHIFDPRTLQSEKQVYFPDSRSNLQCYVGNYDSQTVIRCPEWSTGCTKRTICK